MQAPPPLLLSTYDAATQLFGLTENASGSRRMPIAIRPANISPELLTYLQSADIFTCLESELVDKGFEGCESRRAPPSGHYHHEAFFHGLETPYPVESMSPRTAIDFEKPAAPIELRAFAVALREMNSDWIARCFAGNQTLNLRFQNMLQKQYVFADLAVQIHFGEEVPENMISWHRDVVNSTLHCALSIRGSRTLHARVCDSSHGSSETTVMLPQQAGNVYIGCPYAFAHAVQYPQCDWPGRTVAVQLRWLLTFEESMALSSDFENSDYMVLMDTLSTALRSATITMPSLEAVLAVSNRLQAPAPAVEHPPAAESGQSGQSGQATGRGASSGNSCTLL